MDEVVQSPEQSPVQSPVQIPGVVVDVIARPEASAPAAGRGGSDPADAGTAPAPGDTSEVAPPSFAPTPVPEDPAAPAPAPVSAPAAAAEAEAPAEKKKPPVRGAGMASGGQPVEAPGAPPAAPVWPGPRNPDEVYVPEEFDVSDLQEVNRELNRARARLFRVSQQLKLVQRTLAEAQVDYDRAMRRELVSISGGTSETRKAMAEIRCEHFENRIIIGKQVVEEWKKRSTDCRDDLKAIENIAHNVRAQMDIR